MKENGCVSINAHSIRKWRKLIFFYSHEKCGSPSISRTDRQSHHLKCITPMLDISQLTASDPMVLVVRQWDFSPSQHTKNGTGTELMNWLPSSFHIGNCFRKFWPDFSKQFDVIVLLTSTPTELTSESCEQVNNGS